MLDALTESFCERCGTRYEFAPPEKLTTIRRTKGVISGLKNYIMSQDSLSDAFNDAMRQQAEALATRQLDAFHSSFSFCIDCRQYTCTNCWNDEAGRCQSCQPLPVPAPLPERLRPTVTEVVAEAAWPATDLTAPPKARWIDLPEPEAIPVQFELVPEPEPEAEVAAEAEVAVEAEPAPEPEPMPVLQEVEPEPEPPVAAEPPPPEPAPAPKRQVRPISDTFVRAPRPAARTRRPAAAAADEETLAARRAQLDLLGLGDPGQGPVGPAQRATLPYRSSGASAPVIALAAGAFWDASAREMAGAITQVGVRTCGQCELSLSATARFCRRCGTPQTQSA
jgi:hypothetical protein